VCGFATTGYPDEQMRSHYHSRRPRTWGRNARIEVIATVVTLAIIVAFVAVFLFVYHDFPFRLGGPPL
jgi:heme/copper-type cytochrome/quinol oxidase subunit 2